MYKKSGSPFDTLPPFDAESGDLNIIIETLKGSRNKYSFDEKLKLFKLDGVMPIGFSFPYDFGFVPNTIGGDGDPLDVLVLMDEAAFAGCLVTAKLIGVIEAEQTERDNQTTRNDRLIAVSSVSKIHKDIKTLNDLPETLIDQIENFFVFYNEAKGKQFKSLGHFGARKAKTIVEDGIKPKQ